MCLCLSILVAFEEDLGFIRSIHTVAHIHL